MTIIATIKKNTLLIPIKFVLGYTKEFLIANVKQIIIINGKNTDLAIDKDVYDIKFELVKGENDGTKSCNL